MHQKKQSSCQEQPSNGKGEVKPVNQTMNRGYLMSVNANKKEWHPWQFGRVNEKELWSVETKKFLKEIGLFEGI